MKCNRQQIISVIVRETLAAKHLVVLFPSLSTIKTDQLCECHSDETLSIGLYRVGEADYCILIERERVG